MVTTPSKIDIERKNGIIVLYFPILFYLVFLLSTSQNYRFAFELDLGRSSREEISCS